MDQAMDITHQQKHVMAQVKKIKEFYSHLTHYLLVIGLLFVVNFVIGTEVNWAIYPALGWGVFIVSHAIRAFELFNFLGHDWEKKEVEKRLAKLQE